MWREVYFGLAGFPFYEDGSKFEGSTKRGCREGKGTLAYSTGEVYEGNWKNDLRVGQGTITFKKGSHFLPICSAVASTGGSFTGEWRDDRMHGFGTEKFASGSTYEGEYAGGRLYGKGVLTLPNGNHFGEYSLYLFVDVGG